MGIAALGNHSGAGNIAYYFRSWQMSADTGLCTLAHFNLYRGAGFQVIFVYAETAGGNLNNGVFTVTIEILVKSSLAGIIINTEFFCSCCKGTYEHYS